MISLEAMKCLVVHEIQREIGRALTSDVLTQFDILCRLWQRLGMESWEIGDKEV